jgi:hypothetical protein
MPKPTLEEIFGKKNTPKPSARPSLEDIFSGKAGDSNIPSPADSPLVKNYLTGSWGELFQQQRASIGDALQQEQTQQLPERLYHVGEQAIGGVGKVLGGMVNTVGGALSSLNPFDNRPQEEKTMQSMRGLNDIIGGGMQTISSPLALSPMIQKAVSLPFEDAAHALGDLHQQITGVDKNSEQSKLVVESFMNGIGGLLGMKGALKGGAIEPVSFKGAWDAAATSVKGMKDVPGMAVDLGKQGFEAAKTKVEDIIPPDPAVVQANATKAAGQIVQGKTADVAAAQRALSNIDTTNAKTYSDLAKAHLDKISELAKKQDETLAQSKVQYKLKNFDQEVKYGDTVINTNPVQDALGQLQELYSKSNAAKDLARITELSNKAEKYSLSLKDVNDLAREYNTAFGEKAFGKTGEPLTSVSAQNYENTRAAVKQAVRDELPTPESKNLDQQMTDLYKSKGLIDKQVEAVNKLQQKVQERGLLEKTGRAFGAAIDTVTGHALKGFIEKFLSRGTGLKTLNALDLQEALTKNIKAIQKYIKMADENPQAFVDAINKPKAKAK